MPITIFHTNSDGMIATSVGSMRQEDITSIKHYPLSYPGFLFIQFKDGLFQSKLPLHRLDFALGMTVKNWNQELEIKEDFILVKGILSSDFGNLFFHIHIDSHNFLSNTQEVMTVLSEKQYISLVPFAFKIYKSLINKDLEHLSNYVSELLHLKNKKS